MTMKVQDYPHLRRMSTGGIINVDERGYMIAKNRARAAGKVDRLEMKVSSLEEKVDVMLSLLRDLKLGAING